MTFLAIGPFLILLACFVLGGNPHNVKLAVVNGEWPQEPICQPLDECLFFNLSCKFLDGIDRDMFYLVPYETEDSAVSAVENGDVHGLLTFPSNYSDSMSQRLLDAFNVDISTLRNSFVNVRMDMTNYHIALMAQRLLLMRFETFVQELLEMCFVSSVVGLSPVHFGEPIYGNKNPVFIEYIVPGVLLSCLFGVTFVCAGVVIILEKEDGMLERIVVAGIKHTEYLAAVLVNQVFLFFSPLIVMLLVAYLCLGMTVTSTLPWIFLLCFLLGLCANSLGMLIGLVAPSFSTALFSAICVFLYIHVTTGLIWPLEGVWSPVMRWICYASPLTWAVEASRSMFSRGWILTDKTVWPGFLSTFMWFAAFILITLFALRGFRVNLVK